MAKLVWHGPQVTSTIKRAAADGLYEAAEHILEESVRVVPFEDSDLSKSGFADTDRENLVAHVGFDTPYAVRQHEELDYRHAPGRKAKYLEDTVNEQSGKVNEIIADKIREAT